MMAIRNYFQLCLLILYIGRIFTQFHEGSPCVLENNGTGVCKLLIECPPRIEEVRLGRRHAQSSRCGFSGFNEIVCCPSEIKEKIGIRPADLACHRYKNEIWAGAVSFRIYAGTEASSRDFPYMVALGYRNASQLSTNVTKFKCGGTIITEKFILTAAHCTRDPDGDHLILVRAGVEKLFENDGAQSVEIAEIIIHPRRRAQKYNDIALLKLSSELKWTLTVKPICLMSKPMDQIKLSSDVSFVATGWGNIDFFDEPSDKLLRTPGLELVSSSDCNHFYQDDGSVVNALDDSVLCAVDKDPTRRADTCPGDSGGPLLMMDTENHTIIGITSFGKSCGIGRTPGVYTSVYHYLEWIEATVWPDSHSDSNKTDEYHWMNIL